MLNLNNYIKNSDFEFYQTVGGKIDIKKSDQIEEAEMSEVEICKAVIKISKKLSYKPEKTVKKFLFTAEKDGNLYAKNLSTVIERVRQKVEQQSRYHPPQSGQSELLRHKFRKDMEDGRTFFETAKPLTADDNSSSHFPEGNFIRVITGDVTAEQLKGLGRMQSYARKRQEEVSKAPTRLKVIPKRKLVPSPGYKDVFASSEGEHAKKGFIFEDRTTINPNKLVEHLDFSDTDIAKVQNHGAWVFKIHPGIAAAVPTKRLSVANPKYVEGGKTQSGSKEWAIRNQFLKDPNIAIYKISKEGEIQKYGYFKNELLPLTERQRKIDEAIRIEKCKQMQLNYGFILKKSSL